MDSSALDAKRDSEMVRRNAPISEIKEFARRRGDYLIGQHAVQKVKELIGRFPARISGNGSSQTKIPAVIMSNYKQARGASILVVEDDEDTHTLIERVLERRSYGVSVARDRVEALSCVSRSQFDLILSDVSMPNLNGFKLLEMIEQRGIETPVIILTAQLNDTDEMRGPEELNNETRC